MARRLNREKQHIIWKSDYDMEEMIKELKENYPDEDEDWYEAAAIDSVERWLGDERMNLDKEINGKIVAFADLGLWNGRRVGFKELDSNNVNSILQSFCNGISDQRIYSDGVDIRCDESHHDGTNYIIFREIREGKDIENLFAKIMSGKEISMKDITTYTRSLVPYVHAIYGW